MSLALSSVIEITKNMPADDNSAMRMEYKESHFALYLSVFVYMKPQVRWSHAVRSIYISIV